MKKTRVQLSSIPSGSLPFIHAIIRRKKLENTGIPKKPHYSRTSYMRSSYKTSLMMILKCKLLLRDASFQSHADIVCFTQNLPKVILVSSVKYKTFVLFNLH